MTKFAWVTLGMLTALLGGFATVGILWAILWMAGVRDRINTPDR